MNIRKNVDYTEMYSMLDNLMGRQLPQMELYCAIGKAVCQRSEKGAAVMAAEYLHENYPDVSGFSPRNVRRMRDFYRTYENHPKLLKLAVQIGWIQNVVIMEEDLTMELREWYLRAVKQFEWSKTALIANIKAGVHENITLEIDEEMCYNEEKTESKGETIRVLSFHALQRIQRAFWCWSNHRKEHRRWRTMLWPTSMARERFHAMLKKIAFSGSDRLYILGDVVDRGPDGIALIQEILEMPNVTMLLGNHEYMMLQYFSPDATEVDHRRWNKNGNTPTLAAFQRLSSIEQDRILDFLKTRPTHLQLEVNRKRFYLIHGFPGENVHDKVWNRPTLDTPNPIPDCLLIIGHTPVLEFIQPESEQEKYAQELESAGDHLKVLYAPGFIDIDCCCGYDVQGKALACIRLEDMEEFYQC